MKNSFYCPHAGLLVTALAWSLVLSSSACSPENAAASSSPDTYTMVRGPMRILVTASAEIQAYKETRIRSEVEGQNTVIFLIPEGQEVKAGDKLVELDASSMIERRALQEIDVSRAEATLTQSTKALEIQIKQVQADNNDAANKVLFAKMDQEKFLGKLNATTGTREMGEQEQMTIAATSDIDLAKAEYQLAKDKYEWSIKLAEKEFITKNELERDRLDMERRGAAVTLAENRYDLLVKFTHIKTRKELEQLVSDTELEQDRVRARGEALLAQATAEKRSRESEYKLAKERLDNLARQIKNAVIKAPTDGLVVYAPQDSGGRRSEFVTEGSTVRERQTLIILPDVTRMIATMKVQESQVDKVRLGNYAEVMVDAMPDMPPFPGRVRRISPLPDSGSRWSNPDLKVFPTEVEIEGINTVLKPGLGARVSILVAEIQDTLRVPLQSVQRAGVLHYVWVRTPSGPVATRVELGQSDISFVEIKSGLKEGEVIYQVRPSGVKAPEWEQPARSHEATPEDRGLHGGGSAATRLEPESGAAPGNGINGEGQPRPRGPGGAPGANPMANNPVMAEIQQMLETRHPELAARMKAEGPALFRDAAFREMLEQDAEIKAKVDAMRTRPGTGTRRPRAEGEAGTGTPGAGPGRQGGQRGERAGGQPANGGER